MQFFHDQERSVQVLQDVERFDELERIVREGVREGVEIVHDIRMHQRRPVDVDVTFFFVRTAPQIKLA